MTTNIEQSVKASVRKLAIERNLDTADLWQLIVMERLLVRISRSNYREHFILKGGMLLTNYLQLDRETRDLDFLVVKMENTQQKLTEVFQEIIQIELSDHFTFSDIQMRLLPHPQQSYQGSRVTLKAGFGKVRFKVSIDIGFGDLVTPSRRKIKLSELESKHIPQAHIELKCYPPEFIFAEKFHAISFLGGMNSRMKDYYDLYLMVQETNLIGKNEILSILQQVFTQRKTQLKIPVVFSNKDIQSLQSRWVHFYRQLGETVVEKKALPKNVVDVLLVLNEWLTSEIGLTSLIQ